jgi:hypothetical protein
LYFLWIDVDQQQFIFWQGVPDHPASVGHLQIFQKLEARPVSAGPRTEEPFPQWCQNSAKMMMIGSGIPSSQSSKPLPKPTETSIAF